MPRELMELVCGLLLAMLSLCCQSFNVRCDALRALPARLVGRAS